VIPFSVADVEEMERLGVDWRQFIPKTNKKPVRLEDGAGIDWRQFISKKPGGDAPPEAGGAGAGGGS
jgi:hypothetical protein